MVINDSAQQCPRTATLPAHPFIAPGDAHETIANVRAVAQFLADWTCSGRQITWGGDAQTGLAYILNGVSDALEYAAELVPAGRGSR